jgi:circadian clock protein KaiC
MTADVPDDPPRGADSPARTSTGIDGLDTVLGGGLPRGFSYLVQGEPGAGKTTIGLQYLLAGVAAGERVLYLGLSHGAVELDAIARSHGWSIEGIPAPEFSALDASDQLAREQTVFSSDEYDAGELADPLIEAIRRERPQRVVIDAIEQLRLLSDRPQRYRRQLLLIHRALAETGGCTALFLADMPTEEDDRELAGTVHAVMALERRSSTFGTVWRRLRVTKGRGMVYQDGSHPLRIMTGGVTVQPRARHTDRVHDREWRIASSAIDGLDRLLGGGLAFGTSCLFLGATGTGKSTLVTSFTTAAAERGERVVVFSTDEREEIFLRRAAGLGMDARPYLGAGILSLQRVELGDLPLGAFADTVRAAVEDHDAAVVAIDSLTGYLHAPADDAALVAELRDLLAYLNDRGVLTLLVMTEGGLLGGGGTLPIDIGYLADTVVLQRHFEVGGRIRKAIAVLKRRHGPHEDSIRELRIGAQGVAVGDPLTAFGRVLVGAPRFADGAEERKASPDDGA